MRDAIATALGIALGLSAAAQNLVLNPSFEDLDSCNGNPQYSQLQHWTFPINCYGAACFNSCAAPPLDVTQGVPMNYWGYEPAHSGLGYVGVRTYVLNQGNVETYITAPLDTQLNPGQTYCLQLWMSRVDTSSFATHTFFAYLTSSIPSAVGSNDSLWIADADVIFSTTAVDEDGWTLLEGDVFADGTEAYLTLGNFLQDSQIINDTTELGLSQWPYYAGYYIDDVYLGPCDVAVSEVEEGEELLVYPNPASDRVNVVLPSGCSGRGELQLFDPSGRVVRDLEPMDGDFEVSNLCPAIYMVRYSSGSMVRVATVTVVSESIR